MNNTEVIEQARAAALAVLRDEHDLSKGIELAYQRSLSRPPNEKEGQIAQDYIENSISGNATAGEQRDVWARFIQTLWATPEFRFLK